MKITNTNEVDLCDIDQEPELCIMVTPEEFKLILTSLQSTTLQLRPVADKSDNKLLLDELLAYDLLRIKLESSTGY